ncbi:ATP-dependent DNA helicase RecG, partial [Candidatus Gottesmanbacteria bacterium]|nr:ATP-dependent DNA helicase RecG [Candidatus Gottesmanbacteria bacterium]
LIHTGRLTPIYPETKGVSSKWIRSRLYSILTNFLNEIKDYLPLQFLSDYHLLSLKSALFKIHFPRNSTDIEDARKRLSFDELFLFQMHHKLIKLKNIIETTKFQIKKDYFAPKISNFINNLPFSLTHSQEKSTDEILSDLSNSHPMNRLLEGDVGSGKTVVAAIAMYAVYLNGYRSALMAPTELLANQHFMTLKKIFKPYRIKMALLTSDSHPDTNHADIYVGTHALIAEKVGINNLALAVIDEQQRFGVSQRTKLRLKGNRPHLLSLTATPIPRTLALTLYADLDLSVIDEMPIGRKKIKTWVVPEIKRDSAYLWMKQQLLSKSKGFKITKQAFIICPFIEKSESLSTVKAVKKEFERLSHDIFSELKLGLLHSRLSSKDRQKVMSLMQKKLIHILVATPIVEVGIDFPDAVVMLIEAADRFGLAQLHQLRGRVGRGKYQSYCLLFSDNTNSKSMERLKHLEKSDIGPVLAEYDLGLRGPGNIHGTKQHGFLPFKIADLSDLNMLKLTKTAVEKMTADPTLLNFSPLQDKLRQAKISYVPAD